MKFVQVREAKASLSSFLEVCQGEHVVITKHGRPCAVLTGVEGYDLEDLMTAADPEFWKLIEKRRSNPGRGMTLEEAREHFSNKEEREEERAVRSQPPAKNRRRPQRK